MLSSAAAMLIRACSGDIAITRRVHSSSSLRGDVCRSELPAPPGVPLPSQGPRTGQSTDHAGRDAENAGDLRRAEEGRSLGSRKGFAVLLGRGEAVTLRWCVRVWAGARRGSGSGTTLMLESPVRTD